MKSPAIASNLADRVFTSSELPGKFDSAHPAKSEKRDKLSMVIPHQSTPASKPKTYSMDRFNSDPVFSQPEFRYTSSIRSIPANTSRAVAVLRHFDNTFQTGETARPLEWGLDNEEVTALMVRVKYFRKV